MFFSRAKDQSLFGASDALGKISVSSEGEPECQIWDPTGRVIALTEGIARIQYLPLVLHEKRGQALLAPRSFSREQRSRL